MIKTFKEFFTHYYAEDGENEKELENGEVVWLCYNWRNEFIVRDFIEAMNYERNGNSKFNIDELLLYTKILIRDCDNTIKLDEWNLKKEIEQKSESADMIEGFKGIIDEIKWKKKKLEVYYEEFEKELLNNLRLNFIKPSKKNPPMLEYKKQKKFIWNDTEENLLILIEKMIHSGLIDSSCWNERYAIIRDTFLNKKSEPFKSKQLSVTNIRTDSSKKIESLNFRKLYENFEINFKK